MPLTVPARTTTERLEPAMKFVLPAFGTRGDVEPCIVVGRELARRGHDVLMAVPPNLVGLAKSAGFEAVAYGLDSQISMELQRNYWTCFYHAPWKFRELSRMAREIEQFGAECWEQMTATLPPLVDGADLIITGLIYEQPAVNVSESCGIPLATVQAVPVRPHGQMMPFLPAPLSRLVMAANEWMSWRAMQKVEDAQRRQLGLPRAKVAASRRIAQRGALEIQAYDKVCFPGLVADWAKWGDHRPFVGALSLELPPDADEEVEPWIAAGTPPIFFGFGSIPVESPSETIAMISAVCARLGERALVCAGWSDYGNVALPEHVKLVRALDAATVFPACRAVVHHGGGGTTCAGLRAGVPALILWTLPDQPAWGAAVKRLKVGTARRFSSANEESMVSDLRTILAPDYIARARELATRMTQPADAAAAAADRVQEFARLRGVVV